MEADLQDAGVDVGDKALLRRRTYRWLQVRILGLLSRPPAILYDPAGQLHRVPSTRLALHLDPPALPSRVTQDGQQAAEPVG